MTVRILYAVFLAATTTVGFGQQLEAAELDLSSYSSKANYGSLGDPSRPALRHDGQADAYIGSYNGDSEFFYGAIDELRLYQSSLSEKAIQSLAAGNPQVEQEALAAYWPFDGNLKNSRGGNAILGDARFVTGRHGQALQLDQGKNQSARVQHYAGLKPTTGQLTMSAWVRPSATPDEWMEIYRKEDGSARQLFALGQTEFYGLWMGLGFGNQYLEVGAPIDRSRLTDGKWHHVAGTFDGKAMRLFLDGREIGVQNFQVSGETNVAADAQEDQLRIAFIGNTLVDRDADYGYLETELTRLLPERELVFRNLGWPADTIAGLARAEFGPSERDQGGWQRPAREFGDYGFQKMLRHIRSAAPDVLFVAYGSNVAFREEAGLKDFQAGLDRFLDVLEPTGVEIVLMSPPPRDTRGGDLAHLESQNEWLSKAADHLKKIAAERDLLYLDLFGQWPEDAADYTDNGIHLNEVGYRQLATLVVQELGIKNPVWRCHLKADGSLVDSAGSEAEPAVRTQYGFRWRMKDARLPMPSSMANAATAKASRQIRIEGLADGVYVLDIDGQRVLRGSAAQWNEGMVIESGPDLEQLERLRQKVLEKNRLSFYGFRPQNKAYIHLFRRHERGHHAAELERFQVLVHEAEERIADMKVPRNRYYELVREDDYPDDEVPNDSSQPNVDAELASFSVPEGFEISLFASDPMIANPININWDAQGRMWVATSTIYPHLQPGQTPDDRIIILEDLDKDGRADKHTVFADGLLIPHSVLPGNGGAYVTQSTDVLFLKDNDGDGHADERKMLLTGFGNADVHHMIHALRWGPDGDIYFNQSIYINSVVETPWGIRQSNGSCIWRLRPDTLRLEIVSRGLVNPWGNAYDDFGQWFATDGAGGGGLAYIFPGSAFRSHGEYGRELPSLNPGRPKECGLEQLTGRHLPEDWRGTFITNDFRANRVTRYRVSRYESGYRSEFLGDMVSSSHRAFRPVDVKMGPDGAIYIVDWYNMIIDHGEVDFHHKLRDKGHGRIWRLSVKDSSLLPPPQIVDAEVSELLDALRSPEQWTRNQARRRLCESGPQVVLPALQNWLSNTASDTDRLRALWVCQGLRSVDGSLLNQCLTAEDERIRAAAVRVLSDWHSQLEPGMLWFTRAVQDSHPQVRLEAVNALREVGNRQAVEIAMQAADWPLDQNLDFALWRTARMLQQHWLPAFQQGEEVFGGVPARLAFALAATNNRDSLSGLARLVETEGLDLDQRINAMKVLASLGTVEHRALVLERLADFEESNRLAVLAALVESERQAPANADRLVEMLNAQDRGVQNAVVRLAGHWQLAKAYEPISQILTRESATYDARLAAARSLASINPEQARQRFKDVVMKSSIRNAQATAIAAWIESDAEQAATAAVEFLSQTQDQAETPQIFAAFVEQKEGPELLAKVLAGRQLAASVAAAGIQQAEQSGRDVSALIAALNRAGSLNTNDQDWTPARIASVLKDVQASGDARRGEAVFRRAELNCFQCHAIGGAGGAVGPDLSSLGGSARTADILQSLVNPSAKIKEGYQASQLFTDDGRIVTGIIQQRTPNRVRLLDGNNQIVTFDLEEVDEIAASPLSVMPSGLIKNLKDSEIADLVAFLTALGTRDGFRVTEQDLARQWEVLADSKAARDFLNRSGADADQALWNRQFSTVAGSLPVSDLPAIKAANGRSYFVLRTSIPESPQGWRLADPAGVEVLSDKDAWVPFTSSSRPVNESLVLRIDRDVRSQPLTLEWAK